ncbi:MAG: hypothetical protein ACTIJ6_00580 [Leucobacter sp.]
MNHSRAFGISTLLLIGSVALTGCTAGVSTTDAGSIAVVEEFFGHLEAGEATRAAALTDMQFDDEFVDDDFYAASIALPADSRITKTEGYDGGLFTATVEYVLDDPSEKVTLDVTVRELEGELKISGWGVDVPLTIGPYPAAGVVTVNDSLEYTLADEGNKLSLLPGTYAFTYEDPTGLLTLSEGEETSFAVQAPDPGKLSIVPSFMQDVAPAVTAEVERLQRACEAEAFTGASCPPELIEAMQGASDAGPKSVEWFRESGPDIVLKGQGYVSTSTYLVHSDSLPEDVSVSYTGAVTRDASGAVAFIR